MLNDRLLKFFFLFYIVSELFFLCEVNAFSLRNTSNDLIGSKQCKNCHQAEYQEWSKSDHFKSMANANKQSILGDFNDVTVVFHGIESFFFKKDDVYWVTTDNAEGKRKTYKIAYTFGHFPLQQYLIETNRGHLQAFNVAWDSRSKKEGGQKWFHLRTEDDFTINDPFFWTRHFQNWNSRCADCHSTNLIKNFNLDKNTYQTTFSEVNVACEACHGAGKRHFELVSSGKYRDQNTGFTTNLPKVAQWSFFTSDKAGSLQVADDYKNQPQISAIQSNTLNTCGGCHSRRAALSKTEPGKNYHDQFQLQVLEERLYHVDGQIKDEVFVMGSFMQSKMHDKGVTCGNCHNPHSGKLIAEGNALCLQCHQATVFDTKEHHRHLAESEGAQCVACHMPETTYMGVDARRDHSFSIPSPHLSIQFGVPNACTKCHQKTNEWAKETLLEWDKAIKKDKQQKFKKENGKLRQIWVETHAQAQALNPMTVREVERFIEPQVNKMKHATLLASLSAVPSRASAELAVKSLSDKNPLVRRAAITSLQNMPVQVKIDLLLPQLDDPRFVVRSEAGRLLAAVANQVPQKHQLKLNQVIDSYREALKYGADMPANLASLANLAHYSGDLNQVEYYYKKALLIEPAYIPAIINLADLYRAQGKENAARDLLLESVRLAPDSAMAQHALGLYYIRIKQYQKALFHLRLATELADSQPRHWYVYAIALNSQNQEATAISALKSAVDQWPSQVDLLFLLIDFMEKQGQLMEVGSYVSRLSKIAPSSPRVKQLISRYKQLAE